jgi:hypothetical protein
MGKKTANTDGSHMSDVAMARDYIADIGGAGQVKSIIHRAYSRLAEMFPHEDAPANRWTERRVRAFWNQEAAIVQFREMVELHRAAEKAKAERELLRKAREDHAAFIKKTAALRALLEHTDEAFFSDQIAGIRSGLGGVDRPGTEGE